MASAKTRSQLGPGLNHRPDPGSLPETSWQSLEEETLESGLTSGQHAVSKVCGSILQSCYPRHVWQLRLESKRESIRKTKGSDLNVRRGQRRQQAQGPRTNEFHTYTRFRRQKYEIKRSEEPTTKPGLLSSKDETLGLITDPQLPSKKERPEPEDYGAGLKQDPQFAANREVDHTFFVNPGLQLSPTFAQELDQPTVSEPRLKCRTLRSLDSFKPFSSLILLFLLVSFINLTHAGPPRPARPPLLSGQPFIVFWGIKDSSCPDRPDYRSFGIEPEGRVAVFYEDTLGNYPYFVDKNTAVNGGLPQHTKLDLHIQKTQGDVETALPAPRYLGLGVVCWQEWAPQWSRSKDKQDWYQNATRKLLRKFFPDWTAQELEKWSKVDFEAAAQSVMTETLREVQRSRPKALWGMCPYPSCSNGSPNQTALSNYTGECPEEEKSLNDQLLWLWRRSNAIYPLLTLEKIQAETRGATLFLSNQIREALRVASLGGSSDDLPVFPLVRTVYASTNTFLSLSDLVMTIGESAALGTAGVVLWDKAEAKTERECAELSRFTSSVLGPYVSNVTSASRLCSASLCQNRGRCVRLDQDKPTFLHLPPNSQDTADQSGEATDQPDSSPRPDPDPAELWKRDFQCQWFSSSDRDVSDQQSPKDGAPSVGKREDSVGRGLDVLATVSDGISTTTGAYGGQSAGSVSPKNTLETPTDKGSIKSPSSIKVLLLLLLALYLWT